MKLLTRRCCLSAGLTAGLALTALSATAQTPSAPWPTKAVRIVMPSPAGTAPDIVARLVGEKLQAIWGQTVIIENKPGAGGLIGLAALKGGDKDDHGFLIAPASVFSLTPYMYKSKQVDVVADFVPVALLGVGPMMVAVNAASPANSLADLVAMARKSPDSFVVASPMQFSLPHLAADMLSRAAGVPMRTLPYANSGQSLTAVVNGDAQMLIDGIPPIDAMIKANRLKAVAVFADKRLADRPQVATAAETYPGMVINGWFGVAAIKGSKPQVIERVNRDIATVLALPDIVARFEALGLYPKPMTPEQFGAFWASERTRWEKVLHDVGAPVVTQ